MKWLVLLFVLSLSPSIGKAQVTRDLDYFVVRREVDSLKAEWRESVAEFNAAADCELPDPRPIFAQRGLALARDVRGSILVVELLHFIIMAGSEDLELGSYSWEGVVIAKEATEEIIPSEIIQPMDRIILSMCEHTSALGESYVKRWAEYIESNTSSAETKVAAVLAKVRILMDRAIPLSEGEQVEAARLLATISTSAGEFEDDVKWYERELNTLQVGMIAPDLRGIDAYGQQVDLRDSRGKVVVIVFWGFTCPPCVEHLSEMRALVERYGERLKVIGVVESAAAQGIGDEGALRKRLEVARVNWQNIVEDCSAGNTLWDVYNVAGLPTVLVLDQKGVIRHRRIGYAGFDEKLNELIAR
jgi:thiol-disulfide isomerase/thioredoxin